MAKTLALINKDIADHLAQKKIFTPPEATELIQIYNQMGNLLQKPTHNIQDSGMSVDIYNAMLRRFMKLMTKYQTGPSPDISEPQEQIWTSAPSTPTPRERSKTDSDLYVHEPHPSIDLNRSFYSDGEPDAFLTPSKTKSTESSPKKSPTSDLTERLQRISLHPSEQSEELNQLLNILENKRIATIIEDADSKETTDIEIDKKQFSTKTLNELIDFMKTSDSSNIPKNLKSLAETLAVAVSRSGTDTLKDIRHILPTIGLHIPSHRSYRDKKGQGKLHLKRWNNFLQHQKKRMYFFPFSIPSLRTFVTI